MTNFSFMMDSATARRDLESIQLQLATLIDPQVFQGTDELEHFLTGINGALAFYSFFDISGNLLIKRRCHRCRARALLMGHDDLGLCWCWLPGLSSPEPSSAFRMRKWAAHSRTNKEAAHGGFFVSKSNLIAAASKDENAQFPNNISQ